ncbi:uncharacterized protein B0T23DRAFT_404522 [Neurospora hispaniola]|uniref:Uncharacterized protein n=1 Tax=Neurospora hispaniola TaxID=588809 RepID=A0AAJ0I7X6_9PEZI|nr:hypothetical protein B0T23DRAFT_404522 [Neurospora hispaniola]
MISRSNEMNRFRRCILSCCFDGGDDVPSPTQRRIPRHPQNQTAPYFQQAQYQKTQLRSRYYAETQHREYGQTSPSPPRPKRSLPPSKSPIYQHHHMKNDHQPPARPITEWPAPNLDQRPGKISESLPFWWDDAVSQDSYPESPEIDFDPDLTPPPLYHRYPPKQEVQQQHTFPKPFAVFTPVTRRRKVPSSYDISYYFRNSPSVVTPWRPPTPPPSQPSSLPHYEDSSAVANWALGIEKGKWEEDVWEEETERDREEARHQDPRIVSGVSSLSYYSEVAHQHRRPVSDVSSVSSYYSEYQESRALTPIPEVRKWGDAKYEDARREESNWL